MNDADREDTDAPPPRRRRALALLLLLGLGTTVGLAFALWPRSPPPEPPAPPPPPPVAVVEPVAPPEPPVPVPPPPPKPAIRAKKKEPASLPVERRPAATTVVITDAKGGEAHVRKALQRAFSRSLSSVDVRAQSDSGYAVTVSVDNQQESGDDVTVRCAVSIALLPKRNVLASLKTRADASGEGTPKDELLQDAADACGQSLAKDLSQWVRKHPL